MTTQPVRDSVWNLSYEQIVDILDTAKMQQQVGRHALAADAYRRAGQALEAMGKSTLARWCWQELDMELDRQFHVTKIEH